MQPEGAEVLLARRIKPASARPSNDARPKTIIDFNWKIIVKANTTELKQSGKSKKPPFLNLLYLNRPLHRSSG
jgi:hypothetical protein